MGANFVELLFDGTLTKAQMQKKFDAAHEQSRYEDGVSYSGEIGMASGLIFEDEVFTGYDEAYRYLNDRCVKWEEARAVQYTDSKGRLRWLICALCAS